MSAESAARWQQVKQLFTAALERAPQQRTVYLTEACGEDVALRGEIEALLAAHHDAGTFLDSGRRANELAAGETLGPYEIVELIGAGGMGQVYRAKDSRLGRDVAIKIIPSGRQQESTLQRFAVEARAAGSINHPNILAVYDIGTYQGGPYLVSELLTGKTLREVLNGKPLPPATTIDYATQLAQGLCAAHDHGVVHRDLKPENLFATNEGRLKILDFGIAKLVAEATPAEASTITGTVVGTVGYMSPEQLRGERADQRSDIFAFGVILHEMLSGQPAFKRDTPVEIGNAILHEEPRELPAGIPADLKRLVRRCLEKRPKDRFQSAHDIVTQLATTRPAATALIPVFAELKRRRVFRALVGYSIASFAVLQIIEPIMHGLHWPDAALSYVVVALAVGFPIVVALAWIFDVNAGRIERTPTAAPGGGSKYLRGFRLTLLLVGVGLLAAIPGLVYYFVLHGGPRPAAEAPGNPVVAASGLGADPSIAVLPLSSLSSDKEQEYFSDGLTEELMNLLAKVPGLRVAARTSTFAFKGKNEDLGVIAQKLHVGAILEGSVRKAGNRIRISTTLINVADGQKLLWAETYNRNLSDVFAVQDEIAQAVVTALKLKLLQAPTSKEYRAANPEAYNQYLLGQQFLHRRSAENMPLAVQAFEKAVTLDPNYSLAWAGLAWARLWDLDAARTAASMAAGRERAFAAAEKAVALNPDLPEGYIQRGLQRWLRTWDWDGARADLERALALSPQNGEVLNAYALFVLRPSGRLPEAVATQRKATELDPLNPVLWFAFGNTLLESGQLGPGRDALNRSLEIEPKQSYAPYLLGISFLLDQKPAMAQAAFLRSTGESYHLAGAAMAQHDLGHPGESQRALDKLIASFGHRNAYEIGQVYAWRGDKDHSFEWLQRAVAQHEEIQQLKVDPLLRHLRGDQRYTALLKQLNLPVD